MTHIAYNNFHGRQLIVINHNCMIVIIIVIAFSSNAVIVIDNFMGTNQVCVIDPNPGCEYDMLEFIIIHIAIHAQMTGTLRQLVFI